MIRNFYHRFSSLLTAILLLVALFLTSCSASAGDDEEVNGSSSQSAELSATEIGSSAGTMSIHYVAMIDLGWSAEITEGGDFLSFSSRESVAQSSGVVASEVNNTLFLYYDENDTAYDRVASISFCFEGSEAITLTLNQLSGLSEDSPYVSSTGAPRWSEIPTKVDSDSYLYVTHSTELNGSDVRNFSLCFDIENHAAAWVAFPYHKVYDGNVGRNESWIYDPKIPSDYQPNLSSSYSGSYDRGHQMASADRQATVAMNRQTFYFSNMTPQLGTLNQQTWADFEIDVRDQVCTDTLFVVTGADFTTTIGTTTDKNGMVCPLPGAYYKVLLRTRLGNTGKSVSQCSVSELQAIGFWFEHRAYDAIPTPVSVATIEARTGFEFFPTVPDEVKASYTSTDWTF